MISASSYQIIQPCDNENQPQTNEETVKQVSKQMSVKWKRFSH